MQRNHRPVFPKEVLDFLNISKEGVYLDATFGEGGHSEQILEAGAGALYGLDRDLQAIESYQEEGKLRKDPRLKLFHGKFSNIEQFAGATKFDGILVDLGVSTRQLLTPERGFSFGADGPLDMRMDWSEGETLFTRLQCMSTKALAAHLREYLPFKQAQRIANALITGIKSGEIETTQDVAKLAGKKHGPRHPATSLFMALRILINDEMGEIQKAFPKFIQYLKPKARLVVITFHSSEDRLVKRTFKRLSGGCGCNLDPCVCPREKFVRIVTKKVVQPSREETRANPRARSAKLRCVEKDSPTV